MQEVMEAMERSDVKRDSNTIGMIWVMVTTRVLMTKDERDDSNDSQALTGGDISKYSICGANQLLATRSTRS